MKQDDAVGVPEPPDPTLPAKAESLRGRVHPLQGRVGGFEETVGILGDTETDAL